MWWMEFSKVRQIISFKAVGEEMLISFELCQSVPKLGQDKEEEYAVMMKLLSQTRVEGVWDFLRELLFLKNIITFKVLE